MTATIGTLLIRRIIRAIVWLGQAGHNHEADSLRLQLYLTCHNLSIFCCVYLTNCGPHTMLSHVIADGSRVSCAIPADIFEVSYVAI